MDSFRMFFKTVVRTGEIALALRDTGFEVTNQGADEMMVSGGQAVVWISTCGIDQLPAFEFDDADGWPTPRGDVSSVISLLVRRNQESSLMAVRIAHELVANLHGAISWDDNGYWEELYNQGRKQ
jgi:hypothetical protein